VLLLHQIEIIVDLVGVHIGGNLVEMKGQFGQMGGVTP